MDDGPLFEKPLDDLAPEPARRPAPHDEPPRLEYLDTPADDLLAIGRGQRRLVLWVAVGVLYRLGCLALLFALDPPPLDTPAGMSIAVTVAAGALVIDVISLLVFVRFASRLYPSVLVVLFVLALLAWLGLLVVMIANVRATRVLTRNGIRVGLLGARPADLARLGPTRRGGSDAKLPKLGW
jgi:hypothetical protein